MNFRIIVLSTAVALSFCAGARAEDDIYRWRDAQGVWHFSSEAPKNIKAERISVRHSAPTTAIPPPVKSTAVAAKPGAGETPAKNEPLLGPESSNCKTARDSVTLLETSPQVSMDADGDGKQEILNAQQHLEELERRKDQVKIYCTAR